MEKYKVEFESLFGIVAQNSEIDKVKVIDSNDFFETISEIGINIEEEECKNLKNYLCYNNDPNKLLVEKLLELINEFKTNVELKELARKYYEELETEEKINKNDF